SWGILALNLAGWLLAAPAFYLFLAEQGQPVYSDESAWLLKTRDLVAGYTMSIAPYSMLAALLSFGAVGRPRLYSLCLAVSAIAPLLGCIVLIVFVITRFAFSAN